MGTTKNSNNQIEPLDIESKRIFYAHYFSSGTNFNCSFGTKIEIITLLAFLTQELKKRFPSDYKNSYDAITKFIFKQPITEANGYNDYLIALSIITDDLMWGCNEIEKPEKYNSANEIRERIKEIINSWMPF